MVIVVNVDASPFLVLSDLTCHPEDTQHSNFSYKIVGNLFAKEEV